MQTAGLQQRGRHLWQHRVLDGSRNNRSGNTLYHKKVAAILAEMDRYGLWSLP
jgi:hypothetical protein